MPASVENDTLLKAFNQTVQALLDLGTSLGGGGGDCPDVTVNNNVPVPSVSVSVHPTINCSCGGGGSAGIGSGTPIDDDPVDGWVPGSDPEVDTAKCKRVNFVIDKYIGFMGIWDAIFGLLAIGPAEMMAAYLAGTSTLIGAFSSLLLAGSLITLFWAVVTLLIGGSVIMAYITAHLVAVKKNRRDWVCAMYNATTPAEMKQAITDFLSDNLAGLPQSFVDYHVEHLFPNNVINGIFNGWIGAVGDELAAYTPPEEFDCSGCITFPYVGWTFYANEINGSNYTTLDSVNNNGYPYAGGQTIGLVSLPWYVSVKNLTPGTIGDTFRLYNYYPGTPVWSSDSPPQGEVNGVHLLVASGIATRQQFTLTFTSS